MKQIEPHDHHLFYEHEAQRDRAIEKQESEADYAIDKLIRDGKLIETLAGLSPHDGKGISANTKPKNKKEHNTMNTKTKTDERILNASAKAIGPCHLPSKREMADKSAHTPGPWAYAFGAVYGTNSEGEWLGARLLLADRNDPSTAPTERDANCRLAAAAPDLLKVCKLMIARLKGDIAIKAFDAIRQGGMLPSLYAEAETAIAKAEGSAQ